MAVELPDELIVQILSILPAKSILRCRSVCKSWLNLISSTKFKLMHLHNFNQLNPRYFIHRLDYLADKEWFSLHLDDEAFTLDRGTHVQFPFDRIHVSLCFRIVGCCNGVVCLFDDKGFRSCLDRIVLWNPSIRRKLTLTLPMFNKSIELFAVLGFGYDEMSDDYKVVHLFYTHYYRPTRVEVYTVKTGIWREVLFPHNLLCNCTHLDWSQVFFNGFVHWIASYWTPGPSHNSIMTFNTSTELFGEIMLPDDLVKVEPSTMMISVVGESFAVTYYNNLINREEMASSTYKIWVMKEYKNPTSWTLMYNMHFPDIDMGIPWQVRNKGDMIMESSDGNMIVYNYSGCASCICLGYESRMYFWTYVDKYQESLALLDVGHSVPNDEGFDDDRIAKPTGMSSYSSSRPSLITNIVGSKICDKC